MNRRIYIGDGVFANIEAGSLVLTTEDGLRTTNRIVLEPLVLETLLNYLVKEREIASWVA